MSELGQKMLVFEVHSLTSLTQLSLTFYCQFGPTLGDFSDAISRDTFINVAIVSRDVA